MSVRTNYQHTVFACYCGYVVQAIVNNFAPLLFLTFQRSFDIPLGKITSLVTVNFLLQLLVDAASAKFVDKIGYRRCLVLSQLFSVLGIAGLAVFPEVFPDAYTGLLVSIVFYACGGGLLEVLVSPIVEACPIRSKKAAMSLLHSFYCWGHLAVVLLSTAFFTLFGIANWRILAFLWALVPFCNLFYCTLVPIPLLTAPGEGMRLRELLRDKGFLLMLVLMLCAGASEQGISQWASAFAEAGLHVSKTMGDLLGPSLFALLMGISRVFYAKMSEKLPLHKYLSASAALCVAAYLIASLSQNAALSLMGCALCGIAVGVMWPGVFSLCAERFPRGGTAMFAVLALFGDLGCSAGPSTVGFASGVLDGNLKRGVLFGAFFPLLMIVALIGQGRKRSWQKRNS